MRVRHRRSYRFLTTLALAVPLVGALVATAPPPIRAASGTLTILHTNDFHGQLMLAGSNPGLARVAAQVNAVRASVGAGNVLLLDGGDEMQGSLLSNLQKGSPTIAAFNAMGYGAATFGNHEFDWGQQNLTDRTAQAAYPFVSANIVTNDTGNCSTAGWSTPAFAKPYVVQTVAGVNVGIIGVTTTETPIITVATATAGLCFKDPADSIAHYYDTLKAQSDVIVVLSHLGLEDGGYGYGIPVYGDKTLAAKLNAASKPVSLIIGGHSHSNMTAAVTVGGTTIAQAYYNGRALGRADLVVDAATKTATVAWQKIAISTTGAEDATVKGVIDTYSNDPAYQAKVNTPIGYSAVDLGRSGGNVDNMMGTFIDDAIYSYLNTDADPANDIDLFFNNAGGIRTDWCLLADGVTWSSTATDCHSGTHGPGLLTYGHMFTILPFGNATAVGTMTGAQILQVLNQSATLSKGAIQPAGLKYSYYSYKDSNPGPQPYAWGAFDACVVNKTTKACDPLDMSKTYKVGTNEFLAPSGGDNFGAFKYMTNITYWGDMLDAVDSYVASHYGTPETAYMGPNGNGTLDGRIARDGTDAAATGSIVPITILHNNDSHGNLAKGQYVGYTQLATLIKQERLHNPGRTLLLNGGDQIQGDAMAYYFKSAYSGKAADGSLLPDGLRTNPVIAVMNSLGYDAMTLGNHEFNFGSDVFKGTMAQADFPILGANVEDDGTYGLAAADGGTGVQPYIVKDLGGIKVAILGLTNHRVPNYELPSNIEGLTFSDPITTAEKLVPDLRKNDDVVIGLTHIGFTEDPKSVEVDKNVDTNLAAQVAGIDAIVGSHSHTNPSYGSGAYKFLPTIVSGPNGEPVEISQAYRYNSYLGEMVLGLRPKTGGGYEVVARAGQYIQVTAATPEDDATKAIVAPYTAQIDAYNGQVVGTTTVPIDTTKAFTEETNGANLQADASVWELAQQGITADVHLSGAMTNKVMPAGSPPYPATLKISDMFAGMPYENSLVVLRMNGPQLKTVLERAYRNYYYYKYVPGYGGYSYYTTCMIDTNSVGKITYNDLPGDYNAAVNHVVSLKIGDNFVDFGDSATYYRVSTVNYLAAGSCNFNDAGKSLWPLDQIVNDTQLYVRDAVIDYIKAMGTVSPAVEGRLRFINDTAAPSITIASPVHGAIFSHPQKVTLSFSAVDVGDAGLLGTTADIDGTPVTSGQVFDLYTVSLGSHTLTVHAVDRAGNASTATSTFTVTANVASLKDAVNRFYAEGAIKDPLTRLALLTKLDLARLALAAHQPKLFGNMMNSFMNQVKAQSGKSISSAAAKLLIQDAQWVAAHPG